MGTKKYEKKMPISLLFEITYSMQKSLSELFGYDAVVALGDRKTVALTPDFNVEGSVVI